MKRRERTLEDLAAFVEDLKGPLGTALRATGVILERRMRERELTWAELDDNQVVELFLSAFMEAAPPAYPHKNPADLERAVAAMAEGIRMEMAANPKTEARTPGEASPVAPPTGLTITRPLSL